MVLKTDNRFFDDLAKVATGAVGALSGVRGQIRQEIRTQINRFIVEMDFVPREDFETVEAVAREARLQAQRLEARVIELEQHLGIQKAKTPSKTKPKKSAAAPKKPSAKKKK